MYKMAFWISLIFLGCFSKRMRRHASRGTKLFSFESASLPGDSPSASSFHSLSEQESIILKHMNVYQKRIFLMKNTFLRKGIGKQTGGVTPCSVPVG